MIYELIPIDELELDPNNVRGSYVEIRELADSIYQHGLLQNLVVRVDEERKKFVVLAGNRRLTAIHRLVREGRWPPEGQTETRLLCLVADDNKWTQIVENLIRKDVAPWRMGARFAEFVEAGYKQTELAVRMNVSVGTISNYIRIARGLHPDICKELDRLGHEAINLTHYLQLARLTNEELLEPDYASQKKMLNSFLEMRVSKARGAKKGAISKLRKEDRIFLRYTALMDAKIPVPVHAQPYVYAVLNYLCGTTNRLIFPPPPATLEQEIDE